MEEIHLDGEPRNGADEGRDLVRRERRDVSVDAHDRVSSRQQPLRRDAFRLPSREGRALSEQVVECLAPPLSDQALGDDQAAPVGLREARADPKACIPGMARGETHRRGRSVLLGRRVAGGRLG
jgi:hypothetical protein